MSFKVGQSNVSKYYVGNSEVSKMYLGSLEVFTSSTTVSVTYSNFGYSGTLGYLYFLTSASPASGTAYKPSGWGNLATNIFGGDNRIEMTFTTDVYSKFCTYFGSNPNFGGFGAANSNNLTLYQPATGAIITFNPQYWQPFQISGGIRVRTFNSSANGYDTSAYVGGYGTFNDTDSIIVSFNEDTPPVIPSLSSLSMSGFIVSYINQPSRAFDGNFSLPGGSFAASISNGTHTGSILNMTFGSPFILNTIGIQTGYTKISEMTLYYDTSNGSGTGWTSLGAKDKTSGHSNFQTINSRTWWQPSWNNTSNSYTHWKLQATAQSGANSNEYWQELYLADSSGIITFGVH